MNSVFQGISSEMVTATHKLFTLLRKLGATGTVYTEVRGGLINKYGLSIKKYDPAKNMGPSPEELLSKIRLNNHIKLGKFSS